jgi:hypothetical protein
VSDKDVALQRLLDVATEPAHAERARQLAMQWPSLAAALGDFIAAHDYAIPRPLRAAANLVREELGKPPVAAVAEPGPPWCNCPNGPSVTRGVRGHLKGGRGCTNG